jgi:hypothetical protein
MPELGRRYGDWRHLVAAVDAIVCAATPAVTYEVLGECLGRNKPALLTKPLYLEALPDKTMVAPVMVDYVRLFSPHYRKVRAAASNRVIKSIDVVFCGDGPVRGFPGLFDYGPHVFAWIFDLACRQKGFYGMDSVKLTNVEVMQGLTEQKKNYLVTGKAGAINFNVRFGNGAILDSEKTRRLMVRFETDPKVECFALYEEYMGIIRSQVVGLGQDELRVEARKTISGPSSPLTVMCQHFLDIAGFGGVTKPRVEMQSMTLSVLAHQTLKQIARAEKDFAHDF